MIFTRLSQEAITIIKPSKMSHCTQVVRFLLLILSIGRQVSTSGVFELEFLKIDSLSGDTRTAVTNLLQQSNFSKSSNEEDPSDLVRVTVCLKEAFTSQLDGPCTFGNASITLNRNSLNNGVTTQTQAQTNLTSAQEIEMVKQSNFTATRSQQQGSQLTNLVRILFTFRWRKSFTIILDAEQQLKPNVDRASNQQHEGNTELAGLSNSVSNGNGTKFVIANRTTTARELALTGASNRQQISLDRLTDRHIHTENEVVPNLEFSTNKPWVSRFSRSPKSSIAYRFRVYCSTNHYGDGCATFCRARDDHLGHYNCSTTGQKVCLDGWQGSSCDKPICRANCNQQHGFCEKPDTCQCKPGWSGSRCDECITYPGCQNGYCLSSWQCICQKNWGGFLCDQDLNYCGNHEPCKNNGTCQNIAPGRYKCNCPDGFTGVDCDIVMSSIAEPATISAGCARNPCWNGGTCYGFNNLPIDSEQTDTQDANRIYRCHCPPGFIGDYCQWIDSTLFPTIDLIPNITALENSSTIETTEVSQISTEPEIMKNDSAGDNRSSPGSYIYIGSSREQHSVVDIRHIISGVMVASVVGVFTASLLLAWCCLVAIERNKFSFIQMNIIRTSDGELGFDQPMVSTAIRRVHEKIRDSFRRSSRARIKPETKLSLDNVLRPPKPPPTYEESSNHHVNNITIEFAPNSKKIESQEASNIKITVPTNQHLVTKKAFEANLEVYSRAGASSAVSLPPDSIADIQLTCPKHGHLYRKQKEKLRTPLERTPTRNVHRYQMTPYNSVNESIPECDNES